MKRRRIGTGRVNGADHPTDKQPLRQLCRPMARRFPPSTRLGAFIILPHQNRRACGILALVAAIARRTNAQPYLLPCEADKGKAGKPGNWRNYWLNLIKKRWDGPGCAGNFRAGRSRLHQLGHNQVGQRQAGRRKPEMVCLKPDQVLGLQPVECRAVVSGQIQAKSLAQPAD